ncbi:formimidoyltransferase-cyclodeaminase isoform X2 [Dunckerocampus dactyliophorus]|uniref:formimidoyltransferase-cyclodeaminase isoform X2 n=1 Tax=Dunckerocampus dactyliophorus TaxID=161453 RepID=UPI00240550E2|nr:formimidoyltransferase-cyclodeaminase isoform X2 [Dunckerocampus dactyliophorus]
MIQPCIAVCVCVCVCVYVCVCFRREVSSTRRSFWSEDIMAQLVECVPNFSEGRNQEVIDAISAAISSTPGCSLLDVDPGASTNRTVYTFVGPPEAVVEGALNAAHQAFSLIDMSRHSGEHPRIGALDVCPFIPVQNVSMEDCVRCANVFGQKLSSLLQVPVFLYGEAARSEARRRLPSVRAGEYEALADKLKQKEWAPDFGPSNFVASWGATVTGARKLLIAYNVNLIGTKEQAHRIALNIREQGRGKDQPGLLKKVQAMGWYLEEDNLAQVSTNILDYHHTPLHRVYQAICKDAQDLKLPVVGSQVVGLIPLQALLDAADFYIHTQQLFILEEEHKVINKLGLDSLGPFKPKERIIEYMVGSQDDGRLVSLPLQQFVRSVGARTAAPGGGSVSAAIAALGAALGAMVGQMTYGKRQFESVDAVMRRLIPPFHQAINELLDMVDSDSSAFSAYMAALKMPKNSEEEVKRREAAMQDGLKRAVSIPLALAQRISVLWPPLKELVLHGNMSCKSDAQVAVKALETAVFGAYYNVIINLQDITDHTFKVETRSKVEALLQEATSCAATILHDANKRT